MLAAIGVGIGLVLFGVVWTALGILAVLAVLSTAFFIHLALTSPTPSELRSEGVSGSQHGMLVLPLMLSGICSFVLWALFIGVLVAVWIFT